MIQSRFLITKRGCIYCSKAKKAVNPINIKLPVESRIKIIDMTDWEHFGLDNIQLKSIFDKMGFTGYPFMYIDGAIIEPAPTSEQLKRLLTKMLEDEFII